MTPQERDLILEVARRLRETGLPGKDDEADRLIRSEIGSQRDALYLLTQAVILQEQGLREAQDRIRQLESGGQGRGSFLGGAGPSASTPPPLPPQGAAAVSGGGGGSGIGTFLGTAAATAAGVVGGQLIMDGMRRMFGGTGSAASFGGGTAPAGDFGSGAFYGGTAARQPDRSAYQERATDYGSEGRPDVGGGSWDAGQPDVGGGSWGDSERGDFQGGDWSGGQDDEDVELEPEEGEEDTDEDYDDAADDDDDQSGDVGGGDW